MATIINLTPHNISALNGDGNTVVFPPSGRLARVATTTSFVEGLLVEGIPVQRTVYGAVEGLPEPTADTLFIVSGLVLGALQGSGRSDVIAPATGPKDQAIRDDEGRVVAVTRWNAVT